MLIKQADDQTTFILDLERLAAGNGPEAKRATEELRIRKAGLKGERESAHLTDFDFDFDFDFANSPNWALIRDLRLEHHGCVAQIDHLLINRWMDIDVLETKHFHAGLKITEQGEFLRWNSYKRKHLGMPSSFSRTSGTLPSCEISSENCNGPAYRGALPNPDPGRPKRPYPCDA